MRLLILSLSLVVIIMGGLCVHRERSKTWIFMIHLHLTISLSFSFLVLSSVNVRILISFNDMVFCSIYTTRVQPNIDIILAPIALITHSYHAYYANKKFLNILFVYFCKHFISFFRNVFKNILMNYI